MWRFVYGQPNKCHCGNDVPFLSFSRGFREVCSTKCIATSDTITQKRRKTLLKKYGVTHYSKTDEYKEKFKQTNLERYGVENPGQIKNSKRFRAKQQTYFNDIIMSFSDVTPQFDFNEYTTCRDDKLQWMCNACSDIFTSHLVGKTPRCEKCFPKTAGRSNIEQDLVDRISEIISDEIILNSRNIIAPYELDLFFPSHNFAIEMNGVYWHSTHKIDKFYHQQKYKLCNEKGISLLMITDHEWKNNKDLILNMISHRLNLSKNKIYARKCDVSKISSKESISFFSKYHINGSANASHHFGLKYNNEVVAALSLSKNRFKNDGSYEIIRFAVSTHIPGSFSKLFAYAVEVLKINHVTSYADLRYGSGNVYLKNGFVLDKMTAPGYWYFYKNKIYHRLSWTKKKLIKLGFDPAKTEAEIMKDLGAYVIFDCGHNLYRWRKE